MASQFTNPAPSNCADPARLAALQDYDILDTPPEAEFDEVTRLIAHICEVPIAVISLIDAERQWFKSEIGLDVAETPLDHSICAHAVVQEGLFIVPDLTKDDRFANNPLVTEGLRFYAGAPLKSPGGPAIGTLCVLDRTPRELTTHQQDTLRLLAKHVMTILELRRQTRQAEEAREREKKASSAKDRFLGLLSHELRTPLTPAMLSVSMLQGDSSLDPTQREAVEMIQRNVKLQVSLVDDLLDFTRLDQGRLRVVTKPVNLCDLLKEVITSLKRQPDMPLIKQNFTARRTSVNGDLARLKQVFRNILHNAAKYTPAAGRITVEISDLTKETVRVSIADNGLGIAPATLPRIFEPFEQGNDFPAAKRVAGLGLGLALVRGIVDLHHGKVAATSAGHNSGTTVTVDLPSLESAPPVAEIITSTEPLLSPVSLRILLVEDQGATAVSLTRLLFRAGHKVLIADSVSAAKTIAERESFDVLVSDIGLPDGSGYELMKGYRGRSFNYGIALSGHGSDEDRAASLEAGFSQHLTKPVEYSEVETALNRVAVQIYEASKSH